ncbi:hypothetical protein H0H92_008182 [Tricholoma furcatifolium]|nr:hypothetical protein H0H92_008182 [Tricholoma furcatifolium]
MFRLGVLSLLVSASLVLGDRRYVFQNSCPTAITYYVNGVSQGSLAVSANATQYLPDFFDGFVYTDVNGGNANGTGTTRAGFYGDDGYYYIVVDPNHFNVAVSITPIDEAAKNGFCVSASCASSNCTDAYQSPPTAFPSPTSTPPSPPLFSCQGPCIGYTVEFCPGGAFPTGSAVNLNPNGNTAKCMDVRGAVYENGTPVQIYDCNGTGAQKWVLQRGPTSVNVEGTDFCLDAGSSPASGVGLKIWTCYEGLAAQTWYYTDDNRIALENQGQCVDLTNGVLTNSNQLQTWLCTNNDLNQVWTTTPA